jgi:RNA polymerase sigma factor (sigma-70 family)
MPEDQHRWLNFLHGDKLALSSIFLEFHDDLFRYGHRLSADENLVKDAIQDLFLKLWKNRLNLRPIGDIKPYLYRSLRNHIIDSLELQKPRLIIDNENDYPFYIAYSPEDFLINNQVSEEIRMKVIDALNKLTSRQREAIYLRYFEELDFETIAITMDMNVQSVRNTLQRGFQVMRELIQIPALLFMLINIRP